MTAVEAAAAPARRVARAVGRYVALTKPRIIELLLVTTVPAMALAAGGWPGTALVAVTLVGGAMGAGGAHAWNMLLERDLDAAMRRTKRRPLVDGEVSPLGAGVFATALSVGGPALLWWVAGWLAGLLTAAAVLWYVVVYTVWLKRRSVENIVIGGAAGAAPPLIGWAAVTGELPAAAWLLFGVVVLWTPPHFWALAISCRRDYAAARVPMLPVVAGVAATARRSLGYTVATALAAVALPLTDGRVGALYLVVAVAAGAWFVATAARLVARPEEPKAAARLFRGSIAYLALVFGALLVDQLL